jgi:N-succinyldiaminopimelate aminotransferase
MFASRFDSLPPSPFARLDTLLRGIEPGADPIIMSVGQPGHPMPAFVGDILAASLQGFTRYPPALGTEELRTAIAAWIARRYGTGNLVDPARHILPVCGTREALFTIALVAIAAPKGNLRPAALMPNPFYQTYATAAVAAGAEPVYLPATAATGHLPDLDAVPVDVLRRTGILYICSPANPQGSVASLAYWARAVELAREHGFTLFAYECYSELYDDLAPPGVVEAAAQLGGGLANIVFVNSLSKRSNLAGLRSGFCAGHEEFISSYLKFRNIAAPQLAFPIQAVSVEAWNDEAHVETSRALYRAKYRLASDMLAGRFGATDVRAGMFLWLDMSAHGGGEEAARRLWAEAGVRVVPGAYITGSAPDGGNAGAPYIRVALVHDLATTETALARLIDLFKT